MKKYKSILLKENISLSDAMKVFNIDNIPDENTLKTLYRDLSKQHHPDLGGSLEQMKLINQAYDLLKHNIGRIGTIYKPKPGDYTHSKADRDAMEQKIKLAKEKRIKTNKEQYPIMKKMFLDMLDEKGILEYLQQFTPDKLTIDIDIKDKNLDYDSYTFGFRAEVKIHNDDNTTVFYIYYYLQYEENIKKGLSYSGIDETDLFYKLYIDTNIYHNKRKYKIGKKDWMWDVGYKKMENFKEIFPIEKIKKIFGGTKKVTFKKADMFLGLKRELNTKIDEPDIYIYPFGFDIKICIRIIRTVMLRSPFYSTHTFQYYIPGSVWKYLKLPKNYGISLSENENTLNNMIAWINDFKKEVANKKLDYEKDIMKIYEICNDILEKYFPKQY